MVWEDGEKCRLVKQEVVTGTPHKYGKVPHCAENGSICGLKQPIRERMPGGGRVVWLSHSTLKRGSRVCGRSGLIFLRFPWGFFFPPHESRVLAFARVASALFCKEQRHRMPTILCSSQSWMRMESLHHSQTLCQHTWLLHWDVKSNVCQEPDIDAAL
eukprot:g43667.t1